MKIKGIITQLSFLTMTILMMAASTTVWGQTPLGAGDIAVVAYNVDTTDTIRFVALRNLSPGTTFNFTDNGWLNLGQFRAGEGTGTYTAPGTILAGTTITFVFGDAVNSSPGFTSLTPANFALSATGDSIIVYTGPAATPNLIYAVSTGIAWAANAADSNTSSEPIPANGGNLTSGVTTVQLAGPNDENGFYNGTTTGTQAQLLALISDPANWTVNTNPFPLTSFPAAFTVNNPTASFASITGKVATPQEFGVSGAMVTLTDSQGNARTVLTGKGGNYRFRDVVSGETYILSVSVKGYNFNSQIITVTEDMTGINFEPNE